MLTSRLLAVAGAVAIVAGASVARADIRFENVTGQPLVFQIRCHGGGLVQTFRLAPRSYDDIYCINGADAEMRVYTERDNGDRIVVHGTVFDGNTYRLFYDSDGDVSFRSIG